MWVARLARVGMLAIQHLTTIVRLALDANDHKTRQGSVNTNHGIHPVNVQLLVVGASIWVQLGVKAAHFHWLRNKKKRHLTLVTFFKSW